MKTSCPSVPVSAPACPALVARPAPHPVAAHRGFFAALERLVNTAGFVSVDLTDTVFAALHRQDGGPLDGQLPPDYKG